MQQFLLTMVALSFAFSASATPADKNPEMFEQMFQQRKENGFKVLQSVPKQTVQEASPFKSPFQVLVEKQKDYLLQDAQMNQEQLTEEQAYQQAQSLVQDNIVKIKDGFRMGKVL
ncbi:MAG: hypothetical protein HRT44_03890, partial [Bdellovibrionales bacterium]|nr:hypothetical protein [Bdellovibrionales bacterium]